jgi:hypothetical protein
VFEHSLKFAEHAQVVGVTEAGRKQNAEPEPVKKVTPLADAVPSFRKTSLTGVANDLFGVAQQFAQRLQALPEASEEPANQAQTEKLNRMLAVARRAAVAVQARRAYTDPLIVASLRECIYHRYLNDPTDSRREERLQTTLSAIQEEITVAPREVGKAIEYVRREYADLAADQNAFLQELVARVARRLAILGPNYGTMVVQTKEPEVMPGRASGAPPSENTQTSKADPAQSAKGGLLGWLRPGRRS